MADKKRNTNKECKLCKTAHPFCDECCEKCKERCNARQVCRLVQAKRMDADTMAALEVVNMDRMVDQNQEKALIEKDELQKEAYEAIGKIKALGSIMQIARGGNLMTLKQIKDSKAYKDLPEFGTWQKFCEYCGLSRSKVDEELMNLEIFGEEFIAAGRQLQIDRDSFRKLRKSISAGTMVVDAEYVTIGEEKIPLSADHMGDLKEALEQVIDAKDKLIEEKDATIKAKDRVAQEKEKMIQKQAKEIAKYEGETTKKGFKPGEEALLKKIEALKTTFDGFYTTIDPEDNPMLEGDGATDRVKAAFIGVVSYMRTCVQAVYDTASVTCSVHDDDDSWLPQEMRD